ncbi:hypothetical protein Dsin_021595 [Dipteronia sinensis]|uniref:Uncharacterized protein n=1 Tax=Dipteronia sinensis TaxID=43782 RepID=A0AAD9ZZY5_9ROSI|nr:hypothetical protein Dsin_021595 [Dipteronia sinensis]
MEESSCGEDWIHWDYQYPQAMLPRSKEVIALKREKSLAHAFSHQQHVLKRCGELIAEEIIRWFKVKESLIMMMTMITNLDGITGPVSAQLPHLSTEPIAAPPLPKQGLFKSILQARIAAGKTTAREWGRSVGELWRLPPQFPTTWWPPHPPGRGFGHRVHHQQRKKSGFGDSDIGSHEYSLRSPSYKKIAHGINPRMKQRSNISSCCNESIEDDEIYPPTTIDLRRWLR